MEEMMMLTVTQYLLVTVLAQKCIPVYQQNSLRGSEIIPTKEHQTDWSQGSTLHLARCLAQWAFKISLLNE